MDIRSLQYFLAVAQEESITKAAEALHMTQPPLSRQIKDLEKELGKQLFIRGSKKVTLTEAGLLLRNRAEELIELMEKTKAELNSSAENITGDVYIGSGETEGISFFAQAAANLKQKHPHIHYYIYSGNAERTLEKLDKGLIDFGLIHGPIDIETYDYIKLPVSDHWGVLMPADCELAKKDTICPSDLWDQPLIVSHQTDRSMEVLSWLGKDISKLNVVLKYDLIYNASHFVKKGFGYALALDKIINITKESDLCFKPLVPALETSFYIIWKKYQIFPGASKLFLRELQEELNII